VQEREVQHRTESTLRPAPEPKPEQVDIDEAKAKKPAKKRRWGRKKDLETEVASPTASEDAAETLEAEEEMESVADDLILDGMGSDEGIADAPDFGTAASGVLGATAPSAPPRPSPSTSTAAPAPGAAQPADAPPASGATRISGAESFSPEFLKPTADDSTPHVFVAMPFRDDYDDQFYLAILPTVRAQGLLCERMDLDKFTGEITERMFKRIESAKMVIALLDGANPNVYLEVGYAWGVRTPTVLLAHKEEPLPFDVRGHRVLIYDKIYLLKQMLHEELGRLF
jgi:hypothetical protein